MKDQRHPVERLAEEFANRLRAGEQPVMEEYLNEYPHHAELIRKIFPAIARMERARPDPRESAASLAAAAARVPSPIPEALGDFRLLREIGRGGMGVVYEAEQQSLRRRVALKVMAAGEADATRRERFRREAEAAATLHHTNIVAIFGIGESDGLLYYAMQLIDGTPLSQVIRTLRSHGSTGLPESLASVFSPTRGNNTPAGGGSTAAAGRDVGSGTTSRSASLSGLTSCGAAVHETGRSPGPGPSVGSAGPTGPTGDDPPSPPADGVAANGEPPAFPPAYFRAIAAMIATAAEALEHAHQHGILHRDIKPSNLMLDREGTLWITDFGVAKRPQLEDVTRSGEVVGTLRYMAPEQLRGEADPRSDIYSLGLVLYELVTLQPAVQTPSQQWLASVSRHRLPSLRSMVAATPATLDVIVMKALAVDPPDRYATAGQLAEDLRRFCEDRPILARPESPLQRTRRLVRRNPALAAATAVTMLLLLVIAGLLAWFNHRRGIALEQIGREYNRAETNLRDKTRALIEADRQRQRAAGNLEMALAAFAGVIDNIGARGGSDALLDELQEDATLVDASEAMLSDADVALLEELLEFFDRFAVNNSADLGAETAAARERIGDIQQRLGRLAEADASYQQALQIYRRLAGEQPAEPTWMMAQVGVLHQQMIVAGRRGRGGQAVRLFEEARALLKQDATLERSAAGRFALAKLCNTVSSQGTRAALQPRLRALVRVRPSRGAVPAVASVREQRLRREAAANRTAHALLESLVAEDPENVSYRLALARTLRERARIAAVGGKDTAARDALAAAVATLEALSKQFPDANAFRYELAETLRLSFIVTDRRTSRSDLQRALAICDALVAASPESIEYRFLRSGVLNRLALAVLTPRAPQKALELWQRALDDQRVVAGRHPEVVAYQIALARTMLRLLDAYSLVEHRQEALALVDGVLESLRAYRGRATGPKRRRQRLDPLLDRLQQQRDDLAAQPIAER